MKSVQRILAITSLLVGLFALTACQQAKAPVTPLPELRVGVAPFTQPTSATDLLAGFIPDDQGRVPLDSLGQLDNLMAEAMRSTNRTYTPIGIQAIAPSAGLSNRQSALDRWVTIGRKAGVDLLIVPMVINWHQRDGGAAGVRTSAEVMSDIFLIDVRGDGSLVQRSHFNEKQVNLASNLLNLGTFINRGGRWLTAEELTQEAIARALREFGL